MKYIVTIEGQEIPVEVDGQEVRVAGGTIEAHLSPVPGTPLRHLLAGAESLTLAMARLEQGHWEVQFHGARYPVEVVDERTRHIRSLTSGPARKDGAAQLKAPMPGLVVRLLVEPGQVVAPGQGLVVLEAMKMENELKAKSGARIREIPVAPGQAVEKGQVLVEFEPAPGP
jgi:biotin carboxyl carrier protein